MTVLENVMIGRHCRMHAGILGAVFRGRSTVREEQSAVQESYAILEKMGLAPFVNTSQRTFPTGPRGASR